MAGDVCADCAHTNCRAERALIARACVERSKRGTRRAMAAPSPNDRLPDYMLAC